MGDGAGGPSGSPKHIWVHRVMVRNKTDTVPCIAVTQDGETTYHTRVKINGPSEIGVHLTDPLPEGSHVYLTTTAELEAD